MNEYQNKKLSASKKDDSEESSSLQFLGSDKQNDENENEQDENENNAG